MRATLDTLGDARTVWVADSFAGLPAGRAAEAGEPALTPTTSSPRRSTRCGTASRGSGSTPASRFVPGLLRARRCRRWPAGSWALVRLDADTYEPTRLALRCLYPGLAPGGYLVLDDYGSFAGCRRAVDEFRAEHGITEPIEQGRRHLRRAGGASRAPRSRSTRRIRAAARAGGPERARDARTSRRRAEVELAREAAELRRRSRRPGLRAWAAAQARAEAAP